MILLDNILCPAHDVTVNLRKYMMITTIVTPKLIDLLDMILMQNHAERTREHTRELKENCKTCISDCRKTSSASNKISPDILRMTASLYALWDNITVAAPIKEKIQIWESCYAIALHHSTSKFPHVPVQERNILNYLTKISAMNCLTMPVRSGHGWMNILVKSMMNTARTKSTIFLLRFR